MFSKTAVHIQKIIILVLVLQFMLPSSYRTHQKAIPSKGVYRIHSTNTGCIAGTRSTILLFLLLWEEATQLYHSLPEGTELIRPEVIERRFEISSRAELLLQVDETRPGLSMSGE